MQVVAAMDPRMSLAEVGVFASRVELMGFDALHVPETINNSFAVAALALQRTSRLHVRTAVTNAFQRDPLVTAYGAWSLGAMSEGRFELGLGQATGPGSTPYDAGSRGPAHQRMADYVAAVRACFDAFRTGGGIDHRGAYYTLIQEHPEFTPPIPLSIDIPVWLAATTPDTIALAGAVGDGLIAHDTNAHPRFLDETLSPVVAAALADAGRDEGSLPVIAGGPIITGEDQETLDLERERRRRILAFLWSAEVYRPTLGLFGWGHVVDDLRSLTSEQRWDDLPAVLPDEMLSALVPEASYADLPEVLSGWYGDRVAGVELRPPDNGALDTQLHEIIVELQSL